MKLNALGRYLPAFTSASKQAAETLYLDLFSGSIENTHRETGEAIRGSVELALSTSPEFSRLVLCELDPRKAASLREYVQTHHPGRNVVVLEGDCNKSIPAYLHTLAVDDPRSRRAAVFAFVDQYSADVTWEALQALAAFRHGAKKTELWLYFGDSFIRRGLSTGEDYFRRVDAMFGDQRWREIHEGRAQGMLDAEEEKKELVNLMRWRLQHSLGYRRTIPLRVTRSTGHDLYTMIFATDHPVGEKIMTQVLGVAESELQELARRKRRAAQLDKREAEAGGAGFDILNDWADAVPLEEDSSPGLLLLDEPHSPWRLYPNEEPPLARS